MLTRNPLCLESGHSKVETFRKIKKQIQLPSFETFFVFFQQLQIVICMNFLEVALNWIMHWLAMLEPRVINAVVVYLVANNGIVFPELF